MQEILEVGMKSSKMRKYRENRAAGAPKKEYNLAPNGDRAVDSEKKTLVIDKMVTRGGFR